MSEHLNVLLGGTKVEMILLIFISVYFGLAHNWIISLSSVILSDFGMSTPGVQEQQKNVKIYISRNP